MALTVCAFSFLAFPILAKATTEPASVTAGAFTITGDNPTEGTDFTYTGTPGVDGYLCIISQKELTIKNTNPEPTSDLIVVSLPDGLTEAHLVLAGVNISSARKSAFIINGEASISSYTDVAFDTYITLQEGTTNTLSSSVDAGLCFNLDYGSLENGSLTLQGDGKLVCNGTNGAGIGGRSGHTVKNISILSGTITSSSSLGAGIGGGRQGGAKHMSFEGGTINASSIYGAGIGGGQANGDLPCDVSNISISNGEVKAIGGGGTVQALVAMSEAEYLRTTPFLETPLLWRAQDSRLVLPLPNQLLKALLKHQELSSQELKSMTRVLEIPSLQKSTGTQAP